MQPHRFGLWAALGVVTLDMIGIGVAFPLFPALLATLNPGDEAGSAFFGGVLASVYGLMQFLLAPALGNLSDRFGRRPVLLVSLASQAADYALLAVAPTLLVPLVARALGGAFAANYAVVNAYIADTTPPEQRAQRFGLIGAAFGVGFVVGPLIGGVLGSIDVRLPFAVVCGLTLLNLVIAFLFFRESLPPESRRPFRLAAANPVGAVRLLARDRTTLGIAGAFLLWYLAELGMNALWSFHGAVRYGWGPGEIGVSLAVAGIGVGISQAALVGPATRLFGEKRAFVVSIALSTVCFGGYAVAATPAILYASLVINCLMYVAGPIGGALLSQRYAENEQGALQGAIGSLNTFAGAVSPLAFGALLGWGIGPAAPFWFPGAPFAAGAVFCGLAALFAWRSLRSRPGDYVAGSNNVTV